MKIIIAGAGEVGSHLAKMLSGGLHDITVIDSDIKLLDNVTGMADVLAIEGDSTTIAVLKKAAVRKADLFLAVSQVENQNIISAVLAKQLGAKKVIARIDNNEYLEPNNKEMFISLGIDYLFYPERMAAREVITLLGHTSTTEFVDFSGGKLSLAVTKLEPTSPIVGMSLGDFKPGSDGVFTYRTIAISRDGETIIPHGDDRFQVGDTIYVLTTQESVDYVLKFSGKAEVEINNMMILGGSRIAVRIASELQNEVNIKLVDYNPDKAYHLAEILDKTLIINEDGRNTEAMLEEGLNNMDAFVAVTGRSETNILTAMLAKRLGVKKVIAEVENLNYITLAESVGVDTVINKKLITASNIFRFTMNTDVQAIKCLTGCDAEVMEFIVKPNSAATKCPLSELGFPLDATIGGVVRGDNVMIAVGSTQIQAYDRVVVFAKPEVVSKVGDYFN
ncbi:MAG: Trk system potassium transporter TrkA [Rikenellaceae bacterium]|nr:Trk system potassium transporter TrkA [Rikenellaceae bacterium]